MIKNICPTCQTEKSFIDAWRESYTVVILLRCECKDWPVRVENERFKEGDYEMEKWFRVVSENNKIWVNGIKKRNWQFASVVPDDTKGFVVNINGNVRFISDEDMTKVHVPSGKDSS